MALGHLTPDVVSTALSSSPYDTSSTGLSPILSHGFSSFTNPCHLFDKYVTLLVNTTKQKKSALPDALESTPVWFLRNSIVMAWDVQHTVTPFICLYLCINTKRPGQPELFYRCPRGSRRRRPWGCWTGCHCRSAGPTRGWMNCAQTNSSTTRT